jgi:hypothetical protein
MLDTLAFLLSFVTSVSTLIDKINLSAQRRLARRIVQTHLLLQTIIEDADRIFDLIRNAEANIEEFGARRFTAILHENLRAQESRMYELTFQIQDRDMREILAKLDPKFRRQLETSMYPKRRGLSFALDRLRYSTLRLENGELFAITGKRRVLAFPELEKQLQVALDLKGRSKSLSKVINTRIKLNDLM